ncbi:MAG: hypothetical protein K6E27_12930 [Eubacterium sp.]|nr:hypothetical protein [Eubacterium sp.]
MTHLEAQSYIMPFIEQKVPKDKQEDFVLHMRTCEKCHEELEIYYTLLVGMKQLDNNEVLSSDFGKDLDSDLKALLSGVRHRKGFKISAFSIIVSAAILVYLFFYAGFLTEVYSYEQNTKASEQGQYFFYDTFHEKTVSEDIDRIATSNQIIEESTYTTYDRISGFNKMEADYDNTIRIGEELANVETTTY